METSSTLWPLEPHTRGKHLVLRQYLAAWLPILGARSKRILLIDGFAGPGEYQGGETGSPLIALKAFKEHRARNIITAEVVFAFVEKEPDRADHLRTLIEGEKPSLPANCRVDVVTGKFDETMAKRLDAVEEQNKRLDPCFVMIDPFGVSDTPMVVIRRILRNPQSEVYVSFMYEAINRFKNTLEFAPHLNSLFGCDTWQDGIELENPDERKNFFYGLYREQLRDAGAKYVLYFELYEQNRLIYAVFFATHHWKGSDRMKQAIWKVAPWGDFAFHGSRSQQLTLGLEKPDFEPLRQALRTEFGGRGWTPYPTIEEFVASDRTDYHSAQIKRGALKPMEETGRIVVDEESRRRKKTYPDSSRIRFL